MNGPVSWPLAITVFIATLMATAAVVLGFEVLRDVKQRRDVRSRLGDLSDMIDASSSLTPGILRSDSQELRGIWGRIWERVPHLRDSALLMKQAGIEWSHQSYLFLISGCTLGFAALALLVTGSLVIGALAGAIGAVVPYLYLRRRRAKRLARFEELFSEAIDLIGRAVRAGNPFSAGLRMVAEESLPPVGPEFRQVFEEQKLGMPLDESLSALADRVPSTDVRIFLTALLIQREVGGNLAEILDRLSYMIRERFRIQRQVRVLTAEARLSAYILVALPPVVATLMYFINPTYMSLLFTHPIGRLALYATLTLQLLGFLWMRKISTIEV